MVELTFDQDNSRRCAEFSIRTDGLDEVTENFTARLETGSDRVSLVPTMTTVVISDSESK